MATEGRGREGDGATEAGQTHAQKVATILATHGEPCASIGVYRRREAVLVAEVARLRAVEAAARALADHLPPSGAALPHATLTVDEYRAALLLNLRDALAALDDVPRRGNTGAELLARLPVIDDPQISEAMQVVYALDGDADEDADAPTGAGR